MTDFTKPYVILAAMVLIAVLAVAGAAYVNHMNHALTAARVGETTQTARATTATAQSAAQTDAAVIEDRGARRDELSITLHEDHAHALQAAPGAAASVDPALNAVGRRGLCAYAAYSADPGCVGLRVSDPAQLPPADRSDPPA